MRFAFAFFSYILPQFIYVVVSFTSINACYISCLKVKLKERERERQRKKQTRESKKTVSFLWLALMQQYARIFVLFLFCFLSMAGEGMRLC
jgi:Na+/melibiose symporter-like transporter